ncbi:hypothetical protein [Nocardioides jiangxiensis]|uniref:PknH-like extracellular domain-containing protein n=1 Tax=Nocardioides jiangxiensis TaxID=3064524 RepID=A0ABT9B0P8_9ACTN|nr:hypothetical protein [Nocardioides sp. WY-20]MDO7867197.1 hypothetical protein [Nocardioides sp. WY-20]
MKRHVAAIALACATTGACTGPTPDPHTALPTAPVVLPTPQAHLEERLESAVESALGAAKLLTADRTPVQATQTRIRAGAGPGWTSAGFPSTGVAAQQYLTRYQLAGSSTGALFAVLLELEVPAGADLCQAPWIDPDFSRRPCDLTDLPGGTDLLTVEYSNIRETYLVGPHATLAITTMRPDSTGRMRGAPPVDKDQQIQLLLDTARALTAAGV